MGSPFVINKEEEDGLVLFARLSDLDPFPDEDHYSGREKPESSNTTHDSVLCWCPTTEDLDEPHEHAKESSEKENYNKCV